MSSTYSTTASYQPLHLDQALEGLARLIDADLLTMDDVLYLAQTHHAQSHRQTVRSVHRYESILSTPAGIPKAFVQALKPNQWIRLGANTVSRVGALTRKNVVVPALKQLNHHFSSQTHRPLNRQEDYMRGWLNGVLGQYLVHHHNPLATPMEFYLDNGKPMAEQPIVTLEGRVIILIHGLTMNHWTWRRDYPQGVIEQIRTQCAPSTLIYVNYNSGLRISHNGQQLAQQLEQLIQHYPKITHIDLIGHSMGGLVSRSALFFADQQQQEWFNRVNHLVCIGSPHQGAVLERASHQLQQLIKSVPLIQRLAQIGHIRSDGIIDLRHGSVQADDWQHLPERLGVVHDVRKPTPLPKHIKTFFIAGTLDRQPRHSKVSQLIGDALVTVESALGEHDDWRYRLQVPESHKVIFYGLNHLQLQYHPQVAQQIVQWLTTSHDCLDE